MIPAGEHSPTETPPAPVWLLSVHHRHGDDTTAHASQAAALDALVGYVVQFWPEVADRDYLAAAGDRRRAPLEVPADAEVAVETYFEAHQGEWYELREQQVNR